MIESFLIFSKSYRFLWFFLIATFLATNISGNDVPAFPGAEGFGKYSKGGRGGVVLQVTNVNDNGPGSLREALEYEGPRIIVFSVSGVISLKEPIFIDNPFVTLLGHTAPEKGVAIRGNQLHIRTHDVIIRFLRMRIGDVNFGKLNHWQSLDAIDIGNGKSDDVHNIIIDHCSISWATDENIGLWGDSYNITIQNSIISEGLNFGKNIQKRGMGILVGPWAERISILNNLFIHNGKRNPRMGNGGLGDVRNNTIYNPGWMGINIWNEKTDKPQTLNIVKNIFIPGPDTEFEKEISIWDPTTHPGKVYIADNLGFSGDTNYDNWVMVEDANSPRDPITPEQIERVKSDEEFLNEVSKTKSFEEMNHYVQYYVGASLPLRDEVDVRLINEWKSGKGKLIKSQDEVGGWPVYSAGIKRVTLFGEGNGDDIIPLGWREKYNIWRGDENEDFNGNGYTNIEEFFNGTNPLSQEEPSIMQIFEGFGAIVEEKRSVELEQNFPNPFRDYTNIRFSIQKHVFVLFNIYDYTGIKVDELVDAELYPGRYEILWKPSKGLPPGIYLGYMVIGNEKLSIKMMMN